MPLKTRRAATLGLSPECPVLARHSPGHPRRLKRSATLQAQPCKHRARRLVGDLARRRPSCHRSPLRVPDGVASGALSAPRTADGVIRPLYPPTVCGWARTSALSMTCSAWGLGPPTPYGSIAGHLPWPSACSGYKPAWWAQHSGTSMAGLGHLGKSRHGDPVRRR